MAKYEIFLYYSVQTLKIVKNALVARFDSIFDLTTVQLLLNCKIWENVVFAYEIQDFREGLYYYLTLKQTTMQLLKSLTVFQKSTRHSFVTRSSNLTLN